MELSPYKTLGSLIWLQVATHPDLSYTVNLLSRFAHNPRQAHWNVLKHALLYIKEILVLHTFTTPAFVHLDMLIQIMLEISMDGSQWKATCSL